MLLLFYPRCLFLSVSILNSDNSSLKHHWLTTELRRAVYGVAFSYLLAICFESIMKSDRAFRCMSMEGQSEEDLLRYSLMHKAGYILEPELPVVLRMPYYTTALSIQVLQAG